ncbi:MAG: hypothetical protein JWM27_2973 [Gemmatimonadetes bacterium]|nr:hypothetical protein [Gemmatimonadota bacterium]
MPKRTSSTVLRVGSWRAFTTRERRIVEGRTAAGERACCPGCGATLKVRPVSRLADVLPADAVGYDLECRACRRFVCVRVRTEQDAAVQRMRRLAEAVGAVPARAVEMPRAVAA